MSSHHKSSCASCEALKKEVHQLKIELNTLGRQYCQLVEETKDENFSERRVNLLKAHVLQLERQVHILSDAMDSQIQLLSDLQIYGESLEHKLKSHDDLSKDVQQLSKLNKRLKKVPIFKDKLSLPVPYTGRYISKLSVIEMIETKQYLNFKQTSWLENQLSTLHTQLTLLHTTLKVLPDQTDTPTLSNIDPLHLLLKESNDQIVNCVSCIKCVSQELLTISLLVPGQLSHRDKQLQQKKIDVDQLLKELYKNKQKGLEILESVIRTYDAVQAKQDHQLCVQEKEIFKMQQILVQQTQYIETLFSELQNGYKSFLSDIYSQIITPFQNLRSNYQTLLVHKAELQSIDIYIQELHQVMKDLKKLIDSEQSKGIHDDYSSVLVIAPVGVL